MWLLGAGFLGAPPIPLIACPNRRSPNADVDTWSE